MTRVWMFSASLSHRSTVSVAGDICCILGQTEVDMEFRHLERAFVTSVAQIQADCVMCQLRTKTRSHHLF